MKQPTLFDILPEIEPTTTNTLIIGKQAAKTLSKSQQIFNRLSQKIENLQDELQSKTKILYKFYMNNKFVIGNLGNKKRQILKDIISVQLDNILCGDKNEPDEEIKHIYQNIFGVSYEAVAKEGFSEIINEMESMFSNMGLDVDLSDIDIKSGEEDIFRKIKEIEEKAKRDLENEQASQG